jgi:hypothetical protein
MKNGLGKFSEIRERPERLKPRKFENLEEPTDYELSIL